MNVLTTLSEKQSLFTLPKLDFNLNYVIQSHVASKWQALSGETGLLLPHWIYLAAIKLCGRCSPADRQKSSGQNTERTCPSSEQLVPVAREMVQHVFIYYCLCCMISGLCAFPYRWGDQFCFGESLQLVSFHKSESSMLRAQFHNQSSWHQMQVMDLRCHLCSTSIIQCFYLLKQV